MRPEFPALAEANAINTVERFRGGERDRIAVSASASGLDDIPSEADFPPNPNRLNGALSRPKRKLIVLASGTLLRLLASDPNRFARAALWKRLRYASANTPLLAGTTAADAGARVRLPSRRRRCTQSPPTRSRRRTRVGVAGGTCEGSGYP